MSHPFLFYSGTSLLSLELVAVWHPAGQTDPRQWFVCGYSSISCLKLKMTIGREPSIVPLGHQNLSVEGDSLFLYKLAP